jgi:hypothetical protein
MEAGRNVPVAKALLGAKDIPYIVAAPLLLQVFYFTNKNALSS